MTQHLVVVTGARDYPEVYRRIVDANLNTLYVKYGVFTLFHGACRDKRTGEMVGADRYADDWAQTVPGLEPDRFEAQWTRHGYAAGPSRNRAMVSEAVRRVPRENIHGLAFPGPRSRGTWGCVSIMKEFHIEVDVWGVTRAREWLASL